MENDFAGQTVLVTGASGFVGSHLTRRLLQAGANVHVFTRQAQNPWRLADIPRSAITFWETEINDAARVRRYVERIRPQRIFHLAALVDASRSPDLIDSMIDINLKGTAALLLAARDMPLDCFVHAGTCEEYGDGIAPFCETQRESAVSPYSASKIAAAHFCQMMHKTAGMPVVVTRPFLVYGPMQVSNMLVPALIRACLGNEPEFLMTPGEQSREFNYIDDVVHDLLRVSLCKELAGEIINIGNGVEIKIIDVARRIVAMTGSATRLRTELNYRRGEAFHFYSGTMKRARFLSSSRFTPLDEGLRKTIEWNRRHLEAKKTTVLNQENE